ncbi:MAG TPA: DUF4157 domain-containing protein [Methylomirabilota bacterium]|nr:DUF4157 domain-containing protein [Methylomirabilota bacterium]
MAAHALLPIQRAYGNRYVQRVLAIGRQAGGDLAVMPDVEAAIGRSGQGGHGLDGETRRTMESAFGMDFGDVRIHTGAKPDALNRALSATAFTTGPDIFFREGAYDPGTRAGRELLAHELTHVVQQKAATAVAEDAPSSSIQRMCSECEHEKSRGRQVGQLDDRHEQEANGVAKAVSRSLEDGVEALRNGASATKLQRRIGDGHDLQAPRFAGDPVLEACFDNEQLLRFGSQGPAVAKVQQALVDAGFPLPKFGVDGIFRSETQSAVRKYQSAHSLNPDGIVGPLTMGSLDALFATPTPPGPGPTPPGPGPTPPGPGPTPPGPGPTPPGPGPTPPAPAETITSQTVATTPGARTRTRIGVGENVNLTHAPGSTAWTTTAGTLSATNGTTVILTAPDTAQKITVRAGGVTIQFDIVAPTSVSMDREPGTGVKHHLNRADSGIQTRVFLGPDDVNFSNVRYRELDVAGTGSGVYSCNPFSGGHCGAGGGGNPCPDKAMTNTVVAGMGTQSVLGDCAYSGRCGGTPPFGAGTTSLSIPYEYRVGAGPFHQFTFVGQAHILAADGSTLATAKAGATGTTTVAAATTAIVQCPPPP